MNRRANLTALPPLPAGGRLLRKPPPAPDPVAAQPRPFRLIIEGQLAANGQIAFVRVQHESDPAIGLISPAEAEFIAHRTYFAPPAVALRADAPAPAPTTDDDAPEEPAAAAGDPE